jgi:hypothetical protein
LPFTSPAGNNRIEACESTTVKELAGPLSLGRNASSTSRFDVAIKGRNKVTSLAARQKHESPLLTASRYVAIPPRRKNYDAISKRLDRLGCCRLPHRVELLSYEATITRLSIPIQGINLIRLLSVIPLDLLIPRRPVVFVIAEKDAHHATS